MQATKQKTDKRQALMQSLMDFSTKINNDWIWNLSGSLAYTFLTSIIPLLLAIVGIGGFALGAISPTAYHSLEKSIEQTLPSGIGQTVVQAALDHLKNSAGLVLIIGLAVALFSSSRLFVNLEKCSGIIFRLRSRDMLHQNLMAFGMTALYIVAVPLIFAISALPAQLFQAIGLSHIAGGGILTYGVGLLMGLLIAVVFFGTIYVVVPNRPVDWKEVWQGSLVAGVLLILYELLFPFYTRMLLRPDNYGSLAGFVLVIIAFFYYLAFILLLGMEVNSWMAGQRQTAGDLPAIMHEVQAHNTTRGAAGPTAGTPQEDIEHHEGAAAMETPKKAIKHERQDHHDDVRPPKYAEADKADATYTGKKEYPTGKGTTTVSKQQAPSNITQTPPPQPRGKQSLAPTRSPSFKPASSAIRFVAAGALVLPALFWMVKQRMHR